MRPTLKALSVLLTLALGAEASAAATYQFKRQAVGLAAKSSASQPGAGTTTPTPTISATLAPAGLNFTGPVGVPSATKSLTLTNTGNQLLTLNAPSVATPFSLAASSTCGTSLAASTSCTFDVLFTPSSDTPANASFSVQTSAGQKTATLAGTGTISDPGIAGVTLLLHGDGTAGSTAFTDSSPSHLSVTPVGGAKITTSPVKMGTGAISFSTSNDYVSASSANFGFGTKDFTIEFWMYVRSYAGGIVGGQPFGTVNGGFGGYSVNIGESPDRFRLISNARGTWYDDLAISAGKGCPATTWCHMAVVRKGDGLYMFKNGELVASRTGVAGYNYQGSTAVIGRFHDGRNVVGFDGVIDDLRVTAGVARYTTNFTVPSSPYPNQ